jgi:polyisoprenyl-phosphate glycosyltransferase
MMELMDRGADVVYGKRAVREGETWFKRTSAAAFYRLLSRVASVPIPEDTGDFRLMHRRVVDVLLAMPERERFIRGMVSWIGGRQTPIVFTRDPRRAGTTKYTLPKMLRFAADAVTSFSIAPLRYAVWLGLVVAGLASVLLAYTIWSWMSGNVVAGWSSIMTAIAPFSGVQLVVLGIIGEYLGRLVQESKGRPLFLIDSISAGGASHPLPALFSQMPRSAQQRLIEVLTASASDDAVESAAAHPASPS